MSDEEFRSIVAERRSDWARSSARRRDAGETATVGHGEMPRSLGRRILATLMVPWRSGNIMEYLSRPGRRGFDFHVGVTMP